MTEPTDAWVGIPPLRLVSLIVIVVTTVLVDQVTKEWVLRVLTPGEYVPYIGEHIGWQLLFNTGGAFGLAAPSWLFLSVAVLVTILVHRLLRQQPSTLPFIGFALLLGGAYGNIVDRLFRAANGFASGAVVDFVAWGSFPRFNVADAAITVSAGLIVLAALFGRDDSDTAPASDDPPKRDTLP